MKRKVIPFLVMSAVLSGTAYAEEMTVADEVFAESQAPVYDSVVYAEPVYEESVYTEPVYEEPVYEETVYEETVYEEVVYEETVSEAEDLTGEEGFAEENEEELPEMSEETDQAENVESEIGETFEAEVSEENEEEADTIFVEAEAVEEELAEEILEEAENEAAVGTVGFEFDEYGNIVYRNEDGSLKKGWNLIGNIWFYFDPTTGYAKQGFQKIGTKTYFFNEMGEMQIGKLYRDGKVYFLDAGGANWSGAGQMIQSAFHEELEDGMMNLYYLSGTDGAAVSSWQNLLNNWYYFDPVTYRAVSGFNKIGTCTYYFDPSNHTMATGLKTIDSDIYFFTRGDAKGNGSGHMLSNILINNEGDEYFLNTQGKASSGWRWINESWYYFDNITKKALSGFQKLGTCTYYFRPDNKRMVTGLQSISGNLYYFDIGAANGAGAGHLVTNSEFMLDGVKYIAGSTGILQGLAGLIRNADGTEVFYENGSRVLNEWRLVNNVAYWFNAQGVHEAMGQQVTGIITAALRWLGVKEGSTEHHQIIDYYNANRSVSGERGYYSDAWCAMFVSACAMKATVTDLIPTTYNCDNMIRRLSTKNEWVENEDAFNPSAGDLILYDWGTRTAGDNRGGSDHIGIVLSCIGDEIVVIEGNMTMRDENGKELGYDGVGIRRIKKGTELYNQIRGYGDIAYRY